MEQFEKEAVDFVLNTCKTHVAESFNTNDKNNKTINYTNKTYEITVHKQYFHNTCFEQYCVHFTGILRDKLLTSSFYLEWEDNIIGGKLIPANTRWDPTTGIFSNRNIKIKYVNLPR